MYFRNYYECPECHETWTDDYEATSNDECPTCGIKDIEPYQSEDIEDSEL